MRAILSFIKTVFRTLRTVATVLGQMHKTYTEVVTRGTSDPGLPVPNPTAPYWLDDPPYPELVDIHSPSLPADADVVVIGSGIAGAAVAWSLLHETATTKGDKAEGRQEPRVVVLEARQICSGATGRNGGHIKCSGHEEYAAFRKAGLDERRAAQLVRFQLRHLDALVDLCQSEGIEVAEAREVETVDLFIDEETFLEASRQAEDVRKWTGFDARVWEREEAGERFGANESVVGALSYRAGAIWPYRFVTGVWRGLLDRFGERIRIETGTSSVGVEVDEEGDGEMPYRVVTSRGVVRARHVVHATNAHAGHLLPVLRDKLTSLLCHMSSQRPGKEFPDLDGKRSWSIIYDSMGFEYVTQRPSEDGVPSDILLGGGYSCSAKDGLDMIGNWDDSRVDAMTVAHNFGIMPAVFEPKWGAQSEGKPRKAWSGVVGMTADNRPLVGRLDPRLTGRKVPPARAGKGQIRSETFGTVEPGEWIAAGFLGNGMVWAWLSGAAVGVMLAGAENEELPARPGRPGGRLAQWVPEDLLASYERVRKMDLTDIADKLFQ